MRRRRLLRGHADLLDFVRNTTEAMTLVFTGPDGQRKVIDIPAGRKLTPELRARLEELKAQLEEVEAFDRARHRGKLH